MPERAFFNSLCVMEKDLFVFVYQLVKYNAAVSHKEKPGRTYDHQDDFHYSLGIPIPWVRPSHVARFRHNSLAVATQ